MDSKKDNRKWIQLAPGERIIAVVPDYLASREWPAAVAWVYIATAAGKLRMDTLKPFEQSVELAILHPHGASLCAALKDAVPSRPAEPPDGPAK